LEFITNLFVTETHCFMWLYMKQAGNLRMTMQPFDAHLSRVYTRAVYKKYRETYIYSTAFCIDPHPNEVDVYLVTHTNQSWKYAWFQHSFRVEADVRFGTYTCECKTWEHTGNIEVVLKKFHCRIC